MQDYRQWEVSEWKARERNRVEWELVNGAKLGHRDWKGRERFQKGSRGSWSMPQFGQELFQPGVTVFALLLWQSLKNVKDLVWPRPLSGSNFFPNRTQCVCSSHPRRVCEISPKGTVHSRLLHLCFSRLARGHKERSSEKSFKVDSTGGFYPTLLNYN